MIGTGAVASVALARRLGGDALPLGLLTLRGGGIKRTAGGTTGTTSNVANASCAVGIAPWRASPRISP